MAHQWAKFLTVAGRVAGGAVILYGITVFLATGHIPSLLISLAVFIAGPLEDELKKWVRQQPQVPPEEPMVKVVDLATSLVFLVLLLWELFLIRPVS
jgi:hypothetical protein